MALLTFVAPNSPNLGYALFKTLLLAACQVADIQSGKPQQAPKILETFVAIEPAGIIGCVNNQSEPVSQLVADVVAYYYQGASKPAWFAQIADHL